MTTQLLDFQQSVAEQVTCPVAGLNTQPAALFGDIADNQQSHSLDKQQKSQLLYFSPVPPIIQMVTPAACEFNGTATSINQMMQLPDQGVHGFNMQMQPNAALDISIDPNLSLNGDLFQDPNQDSTSFDGTNDLLSASAIALGDPVVGTNARLQHSHNILDVYDINYYSIC